MTTDALRRALATVARETTVRTEALRALLEGGDPRAQREFAAAVAALEAEIEALRRRAQRPWEALARLK